MKGPRRILATVTASALALSSLSSCAIPGWFGGKGEVTLGYLPSWSEGLITAYLVEYELEEAGYSVEHAIYDDVAGLYAAVAAGEVDMYASAWPDRTQQAYAEQHAGEIESLGAYYDDAEVFLAVPDWADVDSIADLSGRADDFGGAVIAVEPEAGITAAAGRTVEHYGLEDEYRIDATSTPGMLSALQTAVNSRELVVVTLWKPFWATAEYPVKALEDPDGAMGEQESLHFLANNEFADEHPELAQWFGEVHIDDQQWTELEQLVLRDFPEGEEDRAVEQWVRDNPGVMPAL